MSSRDKLTAEAKKIRTEIKQRRFLPLRNGDKNENEETACVCYMCCMDYMISVIKRCAECSIYV